MIDKIKNMIKSTLGRFKLSGKKAPLGIHIAKPVFVLKECKLVQHHSNGRGASAQIGI